MRWLISFSISLCLLIPARADLIFKSDAYKDKIIAVYQKLPERGKDKDCSVKVDTEWSEDDLIGLYLADISFIDLRDCEDIPFVFAHEFGHHVWFQSFTDRDRRSWKKFWKRHKKDMPRDYARSNESEGFAECYAMVYYDDVLPKDLELKPISRRTEKKIKQYFRNTKGDKE